MPRFPRPTLVAAAIAAIPLTFAIARAGVDPPPSPSAAREAPKDAVPAAFARVDLRSIMDHAPFREAQLERMREILDRYRPAIDSCRQEMYAIVDEWEKLPEHDEIPPQLEDRTEEVLKRWEKARRGLLRDASEFADGEGRPLRERLRILLDDAARRGGFTAVFQMPREGGGATWGTEGRDDADFGETQAVVWCRDCTDLTDEISEVIGIPEDAWVEGSGFRRVAIEFRGEFESYAEPPPWNWEVAEEDAGEEAPE